jgi:hypothetical protein
VTEALISELRAQYGEAALATRRVGLSTLVKVGPIPIPQREGTTTDVLLDVADGYRQSGGRPTVYVCETTVQPNGHRGRNVNPAMVHGENWLSFSWTFDWQPSQPAWVLVEGALRRFTINDG